MSVSPPSSSPGIDQVVTATSSAAQALSAGNLRATHVTSSNLAGTLQGTIKVSNASAVAAASGQAGVGSVSVAQQQQQQALITALQNQNVSPVRLQTSGGSLVAVAVQQNPTMVSNHGQSLEIVHQQQQQQQQGGGGGSSSVQQNQNQ